jgi:hypothetical protein
MLWAYLKITLSLAIPLSTLIYAREIRHERDYLCLESILQRSISVQWSIDHPREALMRHRAERQDIRCLLEDLDR